MVLYKTKMEILCMRQSEDKKTKRLGHALWIGGKIKVWYDSKDRVAGGVPGIREDPTGLTNKEHGTRANDMHNGGAKTEVVSLILESTI